MGIRHAVTAACSNKRVIALAAIVSIVLLIFLVYGNVLTFWFTDTDEFSLIQTSRIETIRDFGTVISSPFVGDLRTGDFYRPISSLSYSMDYAIWGLNPFGYHLTDMILHAAAAVLTFFLIRLLAGGRQVIACLGAAIFAFNPLLVEVIPSSTRRQDILALVFLLLSLLLFMKYLAATRHKKSLLYLSIASYVVAQGAKETVFILPFLLLFYQVIIADRSELSIGRKVLAAMKKAAPHFGVLVLFLIIRTIVIGRLTGGYCCRQYEVYGGRLPFYAGKIRDYYVDLVHPGGIVGQVFNPFPGHYEKAASIIAVCVISLLCVIFARTLINSNWRGEILAAKVIRLGVLAVAVLSLMGTAAYPLFAGIINNFTQDLYDGNFTHGVWGWVYYYVIQKKIPVYVYYYLARNIFIGLLATSLFFYAGIYILMRQYGVIKKWIFSDGGRLTAFLLFWIVLPMAVFVPNSFANYNAYISLFPVSALFSLLVVSGFGAAYKSIGLSSNGSDRFLPIKQVVGGGTVAAVILMLTFSVPTRGSYAEWNDSANVSKELSEKLSLVASNFPKDSEIHVYKIPERIYSYETEFNHPKDILYLVSYTGKSWLDLNYPGNQMTVTVQEKIVLPSPPGEITFDVKKGPGREVDITANYE